jgi:hypothetical protein
VYRIYVTPGDTVEPARAASSAKFPDSALWGDGTTPTLDVTSLSAVCGQNELLFQGNPTCNKKKKNLKHNLLKVK